VSIYLIDGYNLLHQLWHRPGWRTQQLGGEASASYSPLRGSKRRRSQPHNDATVAPEDPPDLEDERRRLIDRIASYMGGTNDRAVVVFDSHEEALQKIETATSQVEVHFGTFSISADAVIEREVYAANGESIVVVSSDRELQQTTFVPNVIRKSSRQFATDLQEHTKKIANSRNCTTMGHRIEDRISASTLEKLSRLRDEPEAEILPEPPRSK
jgi:predicted RNA-binding protein with PIN domain